jgi:hypothetical protein
MYLVLQLDLLLNTKVWNTILKEHGRTLFRHKHQALCELHVVIINNSIWAVLRILRLF